jgi:hypothetical protein
MPPATAHLLSDLLNYAAFLFGQYLFLLKRAGSAIRSPNTNITTRRQYFYLNWDVALIRGVIEGLIFWACQHYGISSLIGLWGWSLPAWLVLPQNFIVYLPLGYTADSILDWISMSPKLPAFLRSWLSENVPKLNGAAKVQIKLADAAAANQEAGAAIEAAQKVVPVAPKP